MEILAYDIFSSKTRRLFRKQLKKIGFVEVQKSVYFRISKLSELQIRNLKKIVKDNKKNRFIIVPCEKDKIWKFKPFFKGGQIF